MWWDFLDRLTQGVQYQGRIRRAGVSLTKRPAVWADTAAVVVAAVQVIAVSMTTAATSRRWSWVKGVLVLTAVDALLTRSGAGVRESALKG